MNILFVNGDDCLLLNRRQAAIRKEKLLSAGWLPFEVDTSGVRPVLRRLQVQAGTEQYTQVLTSVTLERVAQ
jgi:hypothetical protein